jgi:hypothetical protein
MTSQRRRPVALALAILAGCAGQVRPPAPVESAVPDPALQRIVDPHPAAASGPSWLGADVASSSPLGDGRLVWIFGDTLLGSVRTDCPPPADYCDRDVGANETTGMIASSLAIMRFGADGAPQPMTPYFPHAGRLAVPVLPSVAPGEFLWPMAITRVGTTIVVSASRHTRASGLFSLGSVLLRVRNTSDPLPAWRWETRAVAASRPAAGDLPQLTWMTALVRDGAWIYVFGERARPLASETLLARFPVADVLADTWSPHLEFLAGAGDHWDASYDATRAFVVPGLPGTTEATVYWDRRLGWYSFRIPPLTFDVRLYTAAALAGPWRDRGIVYRLPARWREPRRPDGAPRYVAYAVKAHPCLGNGSDIVLTYNVNLLDGTYDSAAAAAERQDAFYVPQVIRVTPRRR